MVAQKRNGGRIEWQIGRPLNQSQAMRELLHEKAIADATPWRHVEDSVLTAAAIKDTLLDDVTYGRQIADVTSPNFVKQAIAIARQPERFCFLCTKCVRAPNRAVASRSRPSP